MKTNFFRNTAPVIPTGAKRSGGISRLTHDATIKADAHVRRFLGKLGMTALLLSPVLLPAQTNGVTVENLVVNSGSPSTVTFDVSWKNAAEPAAWSDTVWVFVDHNDNGTMKRLELSEGAALTATLGVGKVEQLAGNNTGVRVIGNARINGNFSATVQLLTATTNVAGACAYASNYPPVAEYATASSITFTGTPPFDLVLSTGNVSVQTGYELVGSQTLVSFTDKTGAPGIIKCMPPATYNLIASASGFCASDAGITFSLSGSESGMKYQLYRDGTAVGDELPGTGGAATFTGGPFKEAGMYTAQSVAKSGYCVDPMTGSHNIVAYSAISPGSITTTTATTNAGTNPNVTVQNSSDASGGSGSFTYEWRRIGTSSKTLSNSNAVTYALNSDVTNYSIVGTYYFNRYAKDTACATAVWEAATGTYTLTVTPPSGVNQLQGSCTFTQPPVVGTFATFPSDYSASTYITLMDARDNKNYAVVKIGDRWIMAQNLNYQGVANTSSSLTWQANANSPSTGTGSDTALIGHFWCPGGYSSTAPTSTLESCNVWGALYSWETTMSLDGKGAWPSDAITNYCSDGLAANSANCKQNWGRTSSGSGSGGRGICPPNWHVPTAYEWAVIFDAMESAGGSAHQNITIGYGYAGVNAGSRGKSRCTVADKSTSGNTYVSDTQANWYYYSGATGTDSYQFRVLPAGHRKPTHFGHRGLSGGWWSSTAAAADKARDTWVGATVTVFGHAGQTRDNAMPTRCIQD